MSQCEFPIGNATSEEIKEILLNSKNIAIVGISQDIEKDSYRVAKYLKSKGYKIFPVNPKYSEVLGVKCYPDLKSVNEQIDIVDIFRKPEAIPAVVDEAIEVGAKTVWMQLGLAHNESAEKARKAGLNVIMCKCTKVEHAKIYS